MGPPKITLTIEPRMISILLTSGLVENFKHEWKNDMVVNMATFLAWGLLYKSNFLNNLKSSYKKLGLLENSNLRHFFFKKKTILSTILTIASNNLILDCNSWPTGAHLHHSLNWPLRETSLKWFVFLIGPLNLIRMWFGEDQRETS